MMKLQLLLISFFAVLPCLVHCSCPVIISRSEWGAKQPKGTTALKENPPPYVVVHHSDGAECSSTSVCKNRIKGIQSSHMKKGWKDIGYNFLIGGDGNVYEGRGWGKWGSHVPKYNSKSIGICMIGNFMDKRPSDVQLQTLKNLISCAKDSNYITSDYHLIGHRQGSRTDCPGNELFNELKTWPHFDSSAHV